MAKTFWIVTDRLGSGDEELGRVLMRNFLYSLARADAKPARVMLMNGGVRLACEGSDSLDDVRLLAEGGVVVKVCGTCLDYLGLKDALAVGEIGDMAGSAGVLAGDSEVVTVA
ncbi:MAG: sulfurtransferase-like selenium metabolism protein YedF [Coriobacteriia bacterium]|nr:sulfurtransferase-like selenium metabolism protein YedF [Coriobacteriia bacterium]